MWTPGAVAAKFTGETGDFAAFLSLTFRFGQTFAIFSNDCSCRTGTDSLEIRFPERLFVGKIEFLSATGRPVCEAVLRGLGGSLSCGGHFVR
jgi:hypothetical protein